MTTTKATTIKGASPKVAKKKGVVATFPDPPDKAKADAVAALVTRPSVNAAAVMTEYAGATFGEQHVGALAASLSTSITDMCAGDMKRAEAMLFGQAHALQAIFTNLARRATKQEYLKQWEAYLRMALKAQNQCRMTLEALATIKNPPVVFVRQANINNGGQQQVNNAASAETNTVRAGARAHAATSTIGQTELLEAGDGEWLDNRAAGAASCTDPHLEAVGAIHGAKVTRG